MLALILMTWILAANGWNIPVMVWVVEGVLTAIKWTCGLARSIAGVNSEGDGE